jgi:hypothetical protein
MKKKYCYRKDGKKICPRRYVIRPDRTPYVQDPDTGLMLGRDKKRKSARGR